MEVLMREINDLLSSKNVTIDILQWENEKLKKENEELKDELERYNKKEAGMI